MQQIRAISMDSRVGVERREESWEMDCEYWEMARRRFFGMGMVEREEEEDDEDERKERVHSSCRKASWIAAKAAMAWRTGGCDAARWKTTLSQKSDS